MQKRKQGELEIVEDVMKEEKEVSGRTSGSKCAEAERALHAWAVSGWIWLQKLVVVVHIIRKVS